MKRLDSALDALKKAVRIASSPSKAKTLQGFFKTGPGEYGEGDIFLGVTVPVLRKIAKTFTGKMAVDDLASLLESPFHEERLVALLILVEHYRKAEDEKQQKSLFDFYVSQGRGINNWDLVDLTAPYLPGHFLFHQPSKRRLLSTWAKSKNLWTRRIAIISTAYFIRQNAFNETIMLAGLLLKDKEDLIHKAVGWMLREVGKRDQVVEEAFLQAHYSLMPRTMLRYAIERFPESKRQFYLKK